MGLIINLESILSEDDKEELSSLIIKNMLEMYSMENKTNINVKIQYNNKEERIINATYCEEAIQ